MFTVLRLRPSLSKKTVMTLGMLVLLAVCILVGYNWAVKTVIIEEAGEIQEIKTTAFKVAEVLKAQNIYLHQGDMVDPNGTTKVKEGMIIRIARAVPVSVEVDGTTRIIHLAEPNLEKVLKTMSLVLGPNDVVDHNLDDVEAKQKKVKIIRIEKKEIEQVEKIAVPVKREPDQSLDKGQTKVVQAGAEGLAKVIVAITFADGVEHSREVISREILQEPTPKIIAYGTKEQTTASRELSGRKMLVMQATAYTHTGHRTATGIKPSFGVIAVDPQIIPLGTKLYVEGYGYGTAQDTGGAIKGLKIDVFYETLNEALQWGRRSVKVYILD